MYVEAFCGILIPFLGTVFGAACVFVMRREFSRSLQTALTGFAAGVMVAASVWSLLVPAIEKSASLGRFAFFPVAVGFWIGIFFLLFLDWLTPFAYIRGRGEQVLSPGRQGIWMMVLAVTLHNIPEGMAVGVAYAGWLADNRSISLGGAMALAIGIAIQNFPEGAIISMPLHAEGMKKSRAFWYGVLSGLVEPVGAVLTILMARLVVPILPHLLSFAAGAMVYVVIEELIPKTCEGEEHRMGTVYFAVGFTLMMILDVALA